MKAIVVGLIVVCAAVATVDTSARVHRSHAVLRAFKRQTGYPHGRPGWKIDQGDTSMATETATTLNIGEVEDARELVFTQVFTQGDNGHRYILQPKGTTEDYLSTLQRYPNHSIERTTEHYIDDTNGQWFACYNVDCFDPPMAVIRARSFEDAYEVFCDEFSDWLKVDEASAEDYPEDQRNYNSNGVHIDTDNIQIHPMKLVTILL